MPQDNSSKIRRQIGFFKKLIQRSCASIPQTFTDYDIDEKHPKFDRLDEDQLESLRLELHNIRSSLLKAYSRITSLHDEWTALQQSDPRESKQFDEYITKYGDYRTSVTQAVTQLEELDLLLNEVDNEFRGRDLSVSSDSSENPVSNGRFDVKSSQQDDQPLASQMPHPQRPPFSTSPNAVHAPYTNNALLNFVDASILSKMELPTFDGNMLEFPEFASRFATLVGNKAELDDTTKFSLLKSCLRGRASHAIQGLSVTAENYKIAMDILNTHFNDKVTIKHVLYSKLAELPACDPEGRNLHTLYNRMFALIRQFANGNDDSKETGLGAILLNKLPLRVKSKIYDKTANSHNLSPSELLHLLTDIVRKDTTLQEMSHHTRSTTPQDQYLTFHASSKIRNKRAPPNMIRGNRHQSKPCSFCKAANHLPINCHVFSTAQRRIQYVRDNSLCYNCLSNKHFTRDCTSRRVCIFCTKRHHSSLCSRQDRQKPRTPTSNSFTPRRPSERQSPKNRQRVTHTAADTTFTSDEIPQSHEDGNDEGILTTSNSSTLNALSMTTTLMCTTVTIFNPSDSSKTLAVTAFLDSGSSHSYIREDVAKALDLPVKHPENITISTFGTNAPLHLKSHDHVIGIHTRKGDQQLSVKSLPTLTGNLKHVQLDRTCKENCVKVFHSQPSLLIGNDYFWDMVLCDNFSYETLPNGFRLFQTNIGEVLTGKLLDFKNANTFTSVISEDDTRNSTRHDSLSQLVHKFWTLESIGITDNPDQKDDQVCLQYFNDNIFYDAEDGRYVVKLPFKLDPSKLADNYSMAYCRLLTLQKTLKQNPSHMSKYHEVIIDQLQRGIIEEVPKAELQSPCHYLSHHGVTKNDNNEVKIRCVFDGSAKKKGNMSINEMLHRGPVLLPDLTGILIRCRFPQILISSDIEKAFLMVGLHADSRNYTRFLWLKDPTKPPSNDNIIIYRFTRVPFGLICSPFLLSGTIHHHLTTLPAPLSPDLLRNTYVDNVFHGVENTNEGKHFYACSKELFKRAGMNLRAYVSNSEELNDFFESKESGKISQKQKLLGLHWNINTDELSIPLPYKNPSQVKSTKWTKRKVLKETASIFDPLGLVSPVTLIAKLFLQSLWKINIGWDDELPTDQHMQWLQIMDTWNIPSLTINRLLFPTNIKDASEYELHVFTDASANAYCATAYLVQHQENSPREVSLIMAKSRLAPLHQSITIPRLELSALTIGAKLLTYITKQVDISFTKKFLWTDSTVALTWTKGDKQVPIFVRNRVKTIQENTSNVLIRHVPTASNPADIGTRGATIDELQTLSQWWKGPPFLALDEAHWPESDEKHVQGASPQEEQPDEAYMAVQTNTTNPEDSDTEPRSQDTEKVIDPTRFSKWVTLLHTVTIVLRFLVLCSSKAATIFGRNNIQFIRRAENILLRIAQQENPPTSDQKKQLHLFLCEKTLLWKSEGRLKNAFLPQEAINPTFLPNKNYITTLLILYFHSNNNHCGVNHTLTALRQRFWIPKGRSAVKRAIRNHCYHCRRYNAKPFTLPPFPVHPIQRVTPPQYPFQRMGMDFFGPMQYRSESNIIEKYWMLLFTCLNSRAIYVDIVLNMTTQSVLHVLRRFIATVGCPTWIVCDNALSFKKVAECYSSLPNPDIDKDIIDYCTKKRIQIKFIPSLSPWQGGIYEKMIDIFKKSFKHAIGNRVMNLDDIKTIAKEAEAIVNTRPLTYITDDSDHIPLRPIDFLRPSALLSGPNPDDPPEEWQPLDNTREALLIAWHKTSEALNTFWKRWTYEYLTSLREQYRRTHKTPRSHEEEPPKLNNIVMIHDSTLNKGQWKLGRIIGSKDNYQRSVDIRLPSKKVITRPLNLVYNLEVSSMHQQDERDNSNQGQSQQNAPTGHHMVTRSKARLNVNAITLCVSIFFAQAAFAFNTRCPNEISINKTILYATNCAKEGIAIARYSHQKEERMCWFPVSCPLGAIRSGYPYKNGSTLCGKTCECPKWATSCSFSDSDRISFSELDMIPLSIRNYKPKQVCSFNASPKCDHKKQVGHFHQVQLFDQNLLLVEELTISIKEYIDETDFLCIDRKGWKRRAQKSITGTSRFCEKHLCAPKAKLFCAYDNPLAMLVINDTESSTSIPIKAWGTITKFYFGFPTKLTEAKKDVDAINKSCSKGGISIQSNTTFDVAEVCIHHYCVFLKGITSQTVLFPNKLVMYDYVASIKIWNQGELSYDSELSCKAHPICEILQCYLCWERFYNTQCWNYKHFTIFMLCGATILLAAPLLCIFFKFVRLTFTIMKIILKRLNPIRYLRLPRRQRSFRLPAYTNRRKKKQQKRFISCTILILIQLLQVEGCSEVISVTSTEEVCTIQENKETCTFNHATTITLQPLQQQTCLTLNDPEKRPMGMLTVKPDGIKFRCNKKIEFFTRDHQIVSESVHRCHRAGSCHSDECHHVKDTDALPEFSSEANSRPGYTSCSSSCGCITCDGCFFCEPSCLFHRLYAIPTTPTIYSIFYCPSWELEVDAEISLQREDETTTSTIRLLPGRTSTWNNIRFSLIGTIVPQLPILSSAFVTNGRQTSIVKPAYAGQLQSNSVGQLQCPNLEAAKQFECHFSRNLCTCTNALHKVSCTCYDGSVEDHMEALPLPQTSKNFLVFEKDRNIYAKTHVGSALQLHIVAQDLKITTVKHTSHCQVEASDLSGCYSCTSGASLTLSCKSDNGEVLANMKCNEQTHVIRCTESGFINNILLMFDTSEVAADCTAACPGGIVNFTIKGLLAFVNERIISQSYSATDVERNIKRDFSFVNYLSEMISLFVNKITSFFSFWKTVAFLIVIIVLLELITKLFTKPLHDKAH